MTHMNSGETQRDDLTLIKGIGEATDRWLKESFKVESFGDLAAISCSDIQAGLKSIGRAASKNKIEEWLIQARELAGTPSRAQERDDRSEVERSAGKPQKDSWKPFASFVVEFQARKGKNGSEKQRSTVHHVEADKNEKWTGIEGERLCRWMLERIGEEMPERSKEKQSFEMPPAPSPATQVSSAESQPVEPPPVEAKAEPSAAVRPAGPPPVTLEISEVRAFQPPETETPRVIARAGEVSGGVLRAGEPVSFEISVQLAGPGATEIAKSHTQFRTDIYAHNRSTVVDTYLGDARPTPTEEGKSSYATVLRRTMLERGTYRLDCLATLESRPPSRGYLKVPVLRVK